MGGLSAGVLSWMDGAASGDETGDWCTGDCAPLPLGGLRGAMANARGKCSGWSAEQK